MQSVVTRRFHNFHRYKISVRRVKFQLRRIERFASSRGLHARSFEVGKQRWTNGTPLRAFLSMTLVTKRITEESQLSFSTLVSARDVLGCMLLHVTRVVHVHERVSTRGKYIITTIKEELERRSIFFSFSPSSLWKHNIGMLLITLLPFYIM